MKNKKLIKYLESILLFEKLIPLELMNTNKIPQECKRKCNMELKLD